jgi:glutamate-ammonia-ligase adenylyltransferase
LRLLAESPALLNSILPPLLYSPPMSKLLNQSPHIIDCYMVGDGVDWESGFDSDYVLQADRYETRLERMRRFVNEHLYQLYLLFLNGELGMLDFQAALTRLAEHTLELALTVVTNNMRLDSTPITVIGMGKMGVAKMAPMSDLDLIFVFDPTKSDLETASKFVSRLQTAISTPMREGVVYDLDTRLRPSGRSGAPTVSIESFSNHQLNRAHTWEHIALASARVAAGDPGLIHEIDSIKAQVVTLRRDEEQFCKDATKMWARIAEHRIKQQSADTMSSKLRPGGVMQSEYLAACLILHERPDSDDMHFDALLTQAIRSSTLEGVDQLPDILKYWHTLQLWERLLAWQEKPLADMPRSFAQRMLAQCDCESIAQLADMQESMSQQVEKLMDDLLRQPFADPKELDEWAESAVIRQQ